MTVQGGLGYPVAQHSTAWSEQDRSGERPGITRAFNRAALWQRAPANPQALPVVDGADVVVRECHGVPGGDTTTGVTTVTCLPAPPLPAGSHSQLQEQGVQALTLGHLPALQSRKNQSKCMSPAHAPRTSHCQNQVCLPNTPDPTGSCLLLWFSVDGACSCGDSLPLCFRAL